VVPGAGLVCAGVGAALVAGAGLMVGVWVAVAVGVGAALVAGAGLMVWAGVADGLGGAVVVAGVLLGAGPAGW
jgi:hypothetical protein